jgi:tetratricopeptide (TPR) repeat protein
MIGADVAAARGLVFHEKKLWPAATAVMRRAVELGPETDVYRMILARALMDQFDAARSGPGREGYLVEAEGALSGIRGPSPYHDAQLALLYTRWATGSPDPDRQRAMARQADVYYGRAARTVPNATKLWYNWAYLYITFLSQPEEAYRKAMRALALDPEFEPALLLLGNYHGQKGRTAKDADERRQGLTAAATSYEKAIAAGGPKYPTLAALARVYVDLASYQRAIEVYLEARKVAAASDGWKVDESLARLYANTQGKEAALEHARLALASAPPTARPGLEALMTQIRAMR